MAEIEGQESASPTDAAGTEGQEKLETASPAGDTTEEIIKAASDAEASAASEEAERAASEAAAAGEEKEPTEKAAPYDQDPKWLEARAAQKSFDEILVKAGVDTKEELGNLLDTGMVLQEIVGERDAKQLIEDANTLTAYQKIWKEQDRAKAEESLDPDERADKYKQELNDYKSEQDAKETASKQVASSKQAIVDFDDRVGSSVDKQEFAEGMAEFTKTFLGVKNPFNEVDIFDKKAVTAMANEGIDKVKAFVKVVQQQAIDDYVAGKSEITPISKTEAPDQTTVVKKVLPDDASPDQVFAAARDELLEKLTGGKGV